MGFRLGHAALICAVLAVAATDSATGQSSDERFEPQSREFATPPSESPKATPRRTGEPKASEKASTRKGGAAAGQPPARQTGQSAKSPPAKKQPAKSQSAKSPPAKSPLASPPAKSPPAKSQPAQSQPAQSQPAKAPPPASSGAPKNDNVPVPTARPAVNVPQAAPQAASHPQNVTDEKLALCFACHGANGRSEIPETPSLAAQPAPFILLQLKMMLEGKRQIPAMQPVMSELTAENLRSYADKIAGLQKPAPPPAAPDAARYERGQKLAAASRCANCHNTDFSGAGTNPRLAHQRDDYLVKALRDYKSAARVDPGGIMAASVKELGDAEFADLAYYLANLR
jgi:cytochrome c553